MNQPAVVTLSQKINALVKQNSSLLEKDQAHWLKKHAIDSPTDLAQSIEIMAKEDRLLQIGVVGRVKAGKSSLLNALVFDGHNILPKAATPMTAALTTITYGEQFSAEVEFYSETDIDNIRVNARLFETRLTEEKHNAAEAIRKRQRQRPDFVENELFWEQVEKTALRALQQEQSLAAAHDQYQRILASGVDLTLLGQPGKVQAQDAAGLAAELLNYVGAEGRFMPITKSVNIFLPIERLRDIRIIDTPGLNDPVQSREERTCELLKYCDVVFIVSPSGQFLHEQDLEVMGRITQKEGVQELVLIASQVDNQLYGSDTRQPTLRGALEKITNTLSTHMVQTLQRFKATNPEIGTTFDSLIKDGQARVLHTSGVCHSLSIRFDQQDTWDSGERKVWENLQEGYQDFFSLQNAELSRDNLDLLANTKALEKVLEEVRAKKDRITEERIEKLIKAKTAALLAYRDDLIAFAKHKYQEIKNADVDELKTQQRKLNAQIEVATIEVDHAFADFISDFRHELRSKMASALETDYTVMDESREKSRRVETDTKTENNKSLGGWLARNLWGGGTREVTYKETVVMTAHVITAIERFVKDIGSTLAEAAKECRTKFSRDLYTNLPKTIKTHTAEAVSAELVYRSVKNMVARLPTPAFKIEYKLPDTLSSRGAIKDKEADAFFETAENYIGELKGKVRSQMGDFEDDLLNAMPDTIATEMFEDINARIEQLAEQVENSLQTLDRLQRLQKELEAAA